jgi:hypothetical protein
MPHLRGLPYHIGSSRLGTLRRGQRISCLDATASAQRSDPSLNGAVSIPAKLPALPRGPALYPGHIPARKGNQSART